MFYLFTLIRTFAPDTKNYLFGLNNETLRFFNDVFRRT